MAARTTRRPRHPMPPWIREALAEARLTAKYRERPPYQRNDWIGWITRAKEPATRKRRLASMLSDLRAGDVYMGMPWRPKG